MTTDDPRTTQDTADPSEDQLEDGCVGAPEGALAYRERATNQIWWLMLVLTGLFSGSSPTYKSKGR